MAPQVYLKPWPLATRDGSFFIPGAFNLPLNSLTFGRNYPGGKPPQTCARCAKKGMIEMAELRNTSVQEQKSGLSVRDLILVAVLLAAGAVL